MDLFVATCVPGLESLAAETLKKNSPGAEIVGAADSLVTFHCRDFKAEAVSFFNNAFRVLDSRAGLSSGTVDELMELTLANRALDTKLKNGFSDARAQEPGFAPKTFRVVTNRESQPCAVEAALLREAEKRISRALKLEVNRSLADVEFWFMLRSGGQGFFLQRVSRLERESPRAGELRAELCELLIELSSPRAGEVFLDPFAGYGAIPLARAKRPEGARVMAAELDPKLAAELERRLPAGCSVFNADSRQLTQVPDQSIDSIVTDPPWGLYQSGTAPKEGELQAFYAEIFREFERMLKPSGTLVLLSACKAEVDACLEKSARLRAEKKYDVLVSGKKARVWVMRKEA
jgi:23S rRNA G2445 N2-methylase RlmL